MEKTSASLWMVCVSNDNSKKNLHADIVLMGIFLAKEPILIDLVYANKHHPENIFKKSLYHPEAGLSLHRDMARIVIMTARILQKQKGWRLVLKDGLRTIEAQQSMLDTDIVKSNPHWLMEPRMLSGPGQGGHPRGMAVDVSVVDNAGMPVDMGTTFDTMTAESARNYNGLKPEILENRKVLECSFLEAAKTLNLPLLPLPSEWWDFRFPASYSNDYPALWDKDLPDHLQMTCKNGWHEDRDSDALAKSILLSL